MKDEMDKIANITRDYEKVQTTNDLKNHIAEFQNHYGDHTESHLFRYIPPKTFRNKKALPVKYEDVTKERVIEKINDPKKINNYFFKIYKTFACCDKDSKIFVFLSFYLCFYSSKNR